MIVLVVDFPAMEMYALTIMQVILCATVAEKKQIFIISTIKNFAQSVSLIDSKR